MTESAKFPGLIGGENLTSDKDEAEVFTSESEGNGELPVLAGENTGALSAFANGNGYESFVSESGDNNDAPALADQDDETFASESEDSCLACFAPKHGEAARSFVGGPREGGLTALPEDEAESGPGAGRTRFLGVRLRRAGQVVFFANEDLPVRVGGKVIVEFEQSSAFGEVETILFSDTPLPADATEEQGAGTLALATARDIALHAENRILADEATAFCTTCIRQRSLDMKLVDVEVLHDRSKIIFYFTAPARIDFRELVKDLVRNYRTRIELRQIGVRHEAQMIGGIGNCGRVCCCHQYLRKFASVTIKMAKEQNLFLNPAKLSGMCGRLLCCLSFEQSNYEEFNRRCPKLGKRYVTESGTFRVMRVNMFSRSIVVCSDAGEEKELPLEEWETIAPRRAETPAPEARGPSQPRRAYGEDGRRGRFRGRENKAGRPEADGFEPGGSEAVSPDAARARPAGTETDSNGLAVGKDMPQ